MAWSPWLSDLGYVLADLYPTEDESRRLVACAGLRGTRIRFNAAADVNWFNILSAAERAHGLRPGRPDKVLALLECALRDHPDHEKLLELKQQERRDDGAPDDDGEPFPPDDRDGDAPRWMWITALCITSLLLLFFIAVFFSLPNLTPDRRWLISLLFAVLAGFATGLWTGTALLHYSHTSKKRAFSFSATAGVAVFVFLMLLPSNAPKERDTPIVDTTPTATTHTTPSATDTIATTTSVAPPPPPIPLTEISALPAGADWPASTLRAIERISLNGLSNEERAHLQAEYDKGNEELWTYFDADSRTDDDWTKIRNIIDATDAIQNALGGVASWSDTLKKARRLRPDLELPTT